MSPIKRNGVFYLYIPTQAGGWKLRTTQTGDAVVYRGMKRLVVQLRDERRWALLAAIVNGRLSLGQVYDAHVAKSLDALEASLSASLLSGHVEQYMASLAALGRAVKYRAGVRKKLASYIATLPGGTTAELSSGTVIGWLSGLRTTSGTRRQHLYAVTGFARFLVRVGAIPAYPLSAVEAPKKNAARMRYETEANDRRIVEAASPKSNPSFYRESAPADGAQHTEAHGNAPKRTGRITAGTTRDLFPTRRSPVSLTAPCAWCRVPFTTNRLDVVMCSTACARAFLVHSGWYPEAVA